MPEQTKPTSAMQLRNAFVAEMVGEIDGEASRVESLIEELMFWALLLHLNDGWAGYTSRFRSLEGNSLSDLVPGADPMHGAGGVWAETEPAGEITLLVQPTIPFGSVKHRLDFGLIVAERRGRIIHSAVRIDIECDGHDFHEKTKEQAKRDKRRDRDVQSAGWMVARFTGSEIYLNAGRCASEILDMVRGQQERNVDAEIAADRAKEGKE